MAEAEATKIAGADLISVMCSEVDARRLQDTQQQQRLQKDRLQTEVKPMSTPRSLRVSQQIKRELADIIRRNLKDDRIADLVSITDVDSSADCRAAKVFVSVYGDKDDKDRTLEALKDNLGFIRGEIGRRLKLRFAPELSFKLDDSLERGAKISELLAKISRGEI